MNKSKVLECQPPMRWLIKEEPVYHNQGVKQIVVGSREVRILQQAWKDATTGEIEWIDVPVIEELGFEIIE